MKTQDTYAITGITGQVGSHIGRNLLAVGARVRAVVRDEAKAAVWAERGCEVALAQMSDAGALVEAFRGAQRVFILLPPVFDPDPEFTISFANVAAIREALGVAKPKRVVVLSTIGAQAKEYNLLTQLSLMERALGELPLSMTFLRAAWFMENTAWDIGPARERGVIQSFLQPLDRAVPMVATGDVGRVAAEFLQKDEGAGVVEIEGPRRVTPDDIAATLSKVLGRSVKAEAVARERWEEIFRSQGAGNPLPRMRMLDGFNEGWIEFERGEAGSLKGIVELETVLRELATRE